MVVIRLHINNIDLLVHRFPSLRERLDNLVSESDATILKLESSRSGLDTLVALAGGAPIYLHSKYDPLREAQAIIDAYKDDLAAEDIHVVFYGIGLGYHIEVFCEMYPRVPFSIFEPVPEVLRCYLENRDLSRLSLRALQDLVLGGCSKGDAVGFLERIINSSARKKVFIELPSHVRAFPLQHEIWTSALNEIGRTRISSVKTNFAYQKRWTVNSMVNFPEVLSTPNILWEKRGAFRGIPAVLVAAGPSLDGEIENLRTIKERGLAYLFSVGSAINTLIEHDVYPHAACTYDPTERNSLVFRKIKERGITEIPLVFGTSVGFETLQGYPGPKCHMITSQDTIASFYLRCGDQELPKVHDAPSIAVITLQLLGQLGFSPIVLVGQNLAYKGFSWYATGIDYQNRNLSETQLAKAIKVEDVCGNEIYTNETLNNMRIVMETWIERLGLDVINATQGGAKISGTRFCPLTQVIAEVLTSPVVDDDWFSFDGPDYDYQYLASQAELMKSEHHRLPKLFKNGYSVLRTIERLAKNGNYAQIERMYARLDSVFRAIETNRYFQAVLLPMNRVQYEHLRAVIREIRTERNPSEKAVRVISLYSGFFNSCGTDLVNTAELFQRLNDGIDQRLMGLKQNDEALG